MNEDEILEAARQAIAEGESPDDVARWIQAAGFNLAEMAERQSAQLRVAASGGPVRDFLHQAAEGALLGQADKLAGLGAAVIPGGKGYSEGQEAFQQRTDDLQRLAPGASLAASVAAPVGGLGVGLGRAGQGLYRAIQAARAAPVAASSAGLVSSTGAPLMVAGARPGALEALRALTSPAIRPLLRAGRRALPFVGAGSGGALIGRLFSD